MCSDTKRFGKSNVLYWTNFKEPHTLAAARQTLVLQKKQSRLPIHCTNDSCFTLHYTYTYLTILRRAHTSVYVWYGWYHHVKVSWENWARGRDTSLCSFLHTPHMHALDTTNDLQVQVHNMLVHTMEWVPQWISIRRRKGIQWVWFYPLERNTGDTACAGTS